MADSPTLIFEHKRIPVRGTLVIGRHSDCDFRIATKGASRQHARLEADGPNLWIEDLGSANGTKVNKQPITSRTKLNDGDTIIIGEALFRVTGCSAHKSDSASEPETARIRAARKPDTLVGEVLAGYRVESLIASDDISATYHAKQVSLGRDVALTVLTTDFAAQEPERADGLLGTVRQAAAVQEAHLVSIHECGREDDLLWYSTALVDGDTLKSLLARDGHFDIHLSLVVIERASKALAAAHNADIIHGDLRLETVMLDRSGQVQITNLGLAPLYRQLRGTSHSNRAGEFTAPELADGGDPTASSDMYALGCLLVAMVSGKPPYTGRTKKEILHAHREQPIPQLSQLVPGLTVDTDALLAGLLGKDPSWRFSTVDELLVELTSLRDTIASAPPPASAAPKSQPRIASEPRLRSRKKSGAPIGTIIGFVIAIIIVVMAWPHVEKILIEHTQEESPSATSEDTTAPSSSTTPATTEITRTPTVQPTPTPPTAPATRSFTDDWKALSAQVDQLVSENQWRQAERLLQRFEREAQSADQPLYARRSKSRQQQMMLDANVWYRQAAAELDTITDAKAALIGANALRQQTAGADRQSANQRYRYAADQLRRSLSLARIDAQRALEAGELDRLGSIAIRLEPTYADTPLYDEYLSFAQACGWAESLNWLGSWPATRERLNDATGAQARAAAGALAILNDRAAVLQLLLGNESLADDRERDRLLAGIGRVLNFDQAGDADALTIDIGEVSLADGHLQSIDHAALAAQISGTSHNTWAVIVDTTWAPADSELSAFAVSIVEANIGGRGITLSINPHPQRDGWRAEWKGPNGQTGQHDLELRDDHLHLEFIQIDQALSVRIGATTIARNLPALTGTTQIDIANAAAELSIDRIALHEP